MTREYQRRYRPAVLADVKGQDSAVATIKQLLKKREYPHATMLTGPSGTGKTTLARIVAKDLGCKGADLVEVNAASTRGIDTIREIQSRVGQSPFVKGSTCRVWILDEAHQLSQRSGGDAQTALLKTIEEPPSHVYFFLCTTHPQGLLPTIRSRCTEIKLVPIKPKEMEVLLASIIEKEGLTVADEVIERIINVADGGARTAVKLLQAVAHIEGEAEQLAAVANGSSEAGGIELCRALFARKPVWSDVAKVLAALDDEPESVRHMILGYAQSIMLKGGPLSNRAAQCIQAFAEPTFHTGKPGLSFMCFDFVHAK